MAWEKRLSALRGALEWLAAASQKEPAGLLVELPQRSFAFWVDRGYLVKALGGLPLSFFVSGQHGSTRDEELARRLMKTDEGELVLGVTRQAAATLYQVVGLVTQSSWGRLGRASAMHFHGIWREVGGGIALSQEVLDLFFSGPAEAASHLFEKDWEEW